MAGVRVRRTKDNRVANRGNFFLNELRAHQRLESPPAAARRVTFSTMQRCQTADCSSRLPAA
jgi:hypothetical protein